MAALNFGEWRPDVADLNAGYTRNLANVLPRSDGYGPVRDMSAFTSALPATCRGYFQARLLTGEVIIFAATATRLYRLDNGALTWVDVSKGGSAYVSVDPTANWSFAQFNNFVFAVQKNAPPQVFNTTSSSAFADLGGSPPQAGWVSVVGSFLMLSDLLSYPYRIQWSALQDPTGWTPGTNRSDYQDLPDGGRPVAVIETGSDVAMIMQDDACRRLTYQPGSALVFRVDRLADVPGCTSPYSVIPTVGGVYYLSTRGFVRVGIDGSVAMIGEERVNRTFLGKHDSSVPQAVLDLAYDADAPQLVQGASDPRLSVVMWVYKSNGGSEDYWDRVLFYHTLLDRWTPASLTGEYLAASAQPSLTLENLDEIAPGSLLISNVTNNGSGLIRVTVSSTSGLTTGDYKTITGVVGVTAANGSWTITVIDGTNFDLQGSTFSGTYTSGGVVGGSIDLLTISLDTISTASLPNVAAFDTDNKMAFFNGDTLSAVLETPEQSTPPYRVRVNGIWPMTDAADLYGAVIMRDTQYATTFSESSEGAMNSDGFVPLLAETRYARARVRIPAATAWTYATGVDPDVTRGSRL